MKNRFLLSLVFVGLSYAGSVFGEDRITPHALELPITFEDNLDDKDFDIAISLFDLRLLKEEADRQRRYLGHSKRDTNDSLCDLIESYTDLFEAVNVFKNAQPNASKEQFIDSDEIQKCYKKMKQEFGLDEVTFYDIVDSMFDSEDSLNWIVYITEADLGRRLMPYLFFAGFENVADISTLNIFIKGKPRAFSGDVVKAIYDFRDEILDAIARQQQEEALIINQEQIVLDLCDDAEIFAEDQEL